MSENTTNEISFFPLTLNTTFKLLYSVDGASVYDLSCTEIGVATHITNSSVRLWGVTISHEVLANRVNFFYQVIDI